MNSYQITQESNDTGSLRIDVTDELGRPITGATADISYSGEPDVMIEELLTDSNGQTATISLPAPPIEYSEEPGL